MAINRGALRLATFCLLIVALAPLPAAAQGGLSCTTAGKNLFVREALSDIYLWYDRLPALNPTRFASPEAYLDAVRYRPLDSHFSYITSRSSNDAFFDESQYAGIGASFVLVGTELRVREVFPQSPASEVALERGDRITAIGGRAVALLLALGQLDAALGAAEEGVVIDLQFVDRAGTERRGRLVKRLVTIPTVSHTRLFEAGRRRVGYIFFRNFVQPSTAALDQAFATLTTAGIEDLVLDLRYNGGGYVTVAQHLASLIGGVATEGQILAEYAHNDKNAFRNEVLRFEAVANAARLNRLIVITTGASASASELIINSLRPFMPVVVIGDRTYGKPVGQYQIEFCDKVLAPVAFSLRNAAGEGDYFEGFAPDCPAADDVDHPLGDAAEASLHEALTFIAVGECSAAVAPSRPQPQGARPATRATGWESVVNAH